MHKSEAPHEGGSRPTTGFQAGGGLSSAPPSTSLTASPEAGASYLPHSLPSSSSAFQQESLSWRRSLYPSPPFSKHTLCATGLLDGQVL